MIPQSEGNITIIQRVLKLRKQMEIDTELSTADPRDGNFIPAQMEVSKCSLNDPNLRKNREWVPFCKDA